jgi:multidrug efflux pump subunit AcrA (membrane-fusion protein)
MYARIRLVLKERKNVPLLPDEALMTSEDGQRVFVVYEGVTHSRRVRIGLEEGNLNEALEGLQAGERVVVRGHRMLREGMKVEIEEVDKR